MITRNSVLQVDFPCLIALAAGPQNASIGSAICKHSGTNRRSMMSRDVHVLPFPPPEPAPTLHSRQSLPRSPTSGPDTLQSHQDSRRGFLGVRIHNTEVGVISPSEAHCDQPGYHKRGGNIVDMTVPNPEEPPPEDCSMTTPGCPTGCLSQIKPSACCVIRRFRRWRDPNLSGQVPVAECITSPLAIDSHCSIYSERGIIRVSVMAKFFQRYASRNRYRRMRFEDLDDTAT